MAVDNAMKSERLNVLEDATIIEETQNNAQD